VLWISKHGSACATGTDAYPGVSPAAKQAFWGDVTALLGPLLIDTTVHGLNTTRVEDLVLANARVAVYASDYEEFTGGAQAPLGRFALDGCLVDNNLGPAMNDEAGAQQWELSQFKSADVTKATDKATSSFYLMSMAIGVPTSQVLTAARERWGPREAVSSTSLARAVARCTADLSAPPGMDWCPPSLLDASQLDNYYHQQSLETAWQRCSFNDARPDEDVPNNWGLPNAIYLNGLDRLGLIRTGTRVLWGERRTDGATAAGVENQESGYAYAATFIAYNIRRACSLSASASSPIDVRSSASATVSASTMGDVSACAKLAEPYEALRAQAPLSLWRDDKYGRLDYSWW
jgi:hypothetical protein